MKWEQIYNFNHYCAITGNNIYDVVCFYDKFWGIICNNKGYLSKSLKIEGSFGGHEIDQLPECQFSIKEDAMLVCERHYKLLVLQ